MKKKILIISDNPVMCKHFSEIVINNIYNNYTFEYACSPYSHPDDFLPINILKINLKEENCVLNIISEYSIVISIHCKQIFPRKLVNAVRCINVHPGYNPINRGWYPQVFALAYDLPIGATIHEIDHELDHGDIIVREYVQKTSTDTSLTLYNKVLQKEIELLTKYLPHILSGEYQTIKPETNGNIYLKDDFDKLCKIDLNEKVIVRDFINKLRGLTHGNFTNGYYIDDATGEKIFIKIELSK